VTVSLRRTSTPTVESTGAACIVGAMEQLTRVKAQNDFYDDIHYRRGGSQDTTLCGLKVTGRPVDGEASCMRCREFASGDL